MSNQDPLPGDLIGRLDELTDTAQRTGRAPSMVFALGRRGQRLHLHTAGGLAARTAAGEAIGPTEHTQYRIGSITKTFTATLVLQLRDAGRLDLDDPLERHLPGTPAGASTIRQLLSHTSGLQAEPDGLWWERNPGVTVRDLLAGLHQGKLALPSGRWRHYSNLAFALLAAMVERITGETWRDRLGSAILGPAGLDHTTYDPQSTAAQGFLAHPLRDELRREPTHDAGAMAPAGQLWSTADDLISWVDVLAAGRPGVLEPATAAEMRTVQAIDDPDSWNLGTGLGVQLNRRGDRVYCGHTGSMPGYLACVTTHPPTGWSAVCFANAYTGAPVTKLALDAIEAAVEALPDPPVAWTPAADVPADVADLLGPWWWMGTELIADVRDGRLILRDLEDAAASDAWELERVDADTWRFLGGSERGELLHVGRDRAGTPVELEMRTFVHTRDPWPADPR